MGQEISVDHFGSAARTRFKRHLSSETALLQEALSSGQFSASGFFAGFELEAWLLDSHFFPAANNETYLAHLDHPLVVPELSRFNIELNSTPLALQGDALMRMEHELAAIWQQCRQKAWDLGNKLVMIGILPTVREQDLCLANMSPLNRYHALNTEVIKRRGGKPISIDISGKDHLVLYHADVMLEAATTSFQVHLQIPAAKAARYYNASLMLCAPLVAVAANSPYLFQHDLWEETRIPLFEQSVNLGERAAKRVTFGSGYLQASIMECFEENIADYEILLPMQLDTSADHFEHLRLHNGTIWRWVRPLIGFDQTGTPHVRIEQRIMAAGPSIIDQIANAAFYYGAVHYLAEQPHPPETDLPFATIRDNFYHAAKYGLGATLQWPQVGSVAADVLILDHLLPLAAQGLTMLGIDPDSRSRYLDVIQARVQSRQTGASWQHANLAHHHGDYLQLTASYLHHQLHGQPVHTWNPRS
ncbi:MAG TPA: glutamate--cysteine ligase [Nitrosomonas mobilis]|nr:glutamate--cysteine ligase [Nitrosomonas mobilis]